MSGTAASKILVTAKGSEAMKKITAVLIGLAWLFLPSFASAEPCACGPVRDITFLPQNLTSSDELIVRLEIADFRIVYQDLAVTEIDLENNVIDLTVVTTDFTGTQIDQVQFYPIGILPDGVYTFNLFLAGLNPPPPSPPIPLVFSKSLVVGALGAEAIPATHWVGEFFLVGLILAMGIVAVSPRIKAG